MKLSIIIPCYKEKNYLSKLISLVKSSPVKEKDIILVNDCSDDGTTELIRTDLASEVDRVIYHTKNMGKGAAIKSGLKHVMGDLVII
ncbi:MAG: glycosyltransferase [Candidatus Aminicenantaceae bacterium]